MDPVTHMLVGAVVGQVVAGKRLGFGRAALWGAIAGELPDIDTLMSMAAANDPLDMLVRHRGVTHSLWFGPVVGVIAGYLLSRSTDQPRAGPRAWMLLLTAALLSHPLLDACTHYGTQLLSPFSDRRFAWPALPIIEPIYTAFFAVGLVVSALLIRRRPDWAVRGGALTIAISTVYILYGLRLNSAAADWARRDLVLHTPDLAAVYAFPTLLQLPYRRVLARTANEDWVGFVSMAHPCPIVWDHRPRDSGTTAETLRSSDAGQIFEWFSAGLTAAYSDQTRVFLTDLRYGLVADVLRGNWRLEADLDGSPQTLGRPRFVQGPRPAASGANVLQLLRAAYPSSCDEPAGPLDF